MLSLSKLSIFRLGISAWLTGSYLECTQASTSLLLSSLKLQITSIVRRFRRFVTPRRLRATSPCTGPHPGPVCTSQPPSNPSACANKRVRILRARITNMRLILRCSIEPLTVQGGAVRATSCDAHKRGDAAPEPILATAAISLSYLYSESVEYMFGSFV